MGISLTGDPTEKSLEPAIDTKTFEISPNPTTGILNVQLSSEWEDQSVQFEIYDILGQRMNANTTINSRTVVLEFPTAAPAGLYFVRGFKNGELIQTSQIVLQP